MWVYGRTDLGDLYRGALTLRQVWVRLRSLPYEAPLNGLLEKLAADAEADQKEREVMATLAQFTPPKEG